MQDTELIAALRRTIERVDGIADAEGSSISASAYRVAVEPLRLLVDVLVTGQWRPRLREAVEGRAVIDLHGATVHGRLSVPDIGHFTLARGRFEACSDCTHFPEVTCVDLGTPSSTSFSGPR